VLWGYDYYVKRPVWDDPRGLDKLGHLISDMGQMPPVPFPLDPRGYLDGLGTPYSNMVKYGIHVPDNLWQTVMDAAAADGFFPLNKKPLRRSPEWEVYDPSWGDDWSASREWRDDG
jgi:hypothetical protein